MGNSATQKGYLLMDLTTNKLFVTRDVVFQEYLFPFAEKTTSESPEDFINLCAGTIIMQIQIFIKVLLRNQIIMTKLLNHQVRIYFIHMPQPVHQRRYFPAFQM